MRIDVSRPMYDYKGTPIKIGNTEEDDQATVKDLLEFVLVQTRSPDYQEGEKKYRLYQLLGKIHKAEGVIDIKAEEVATIKHLAGPMLNVPILGALYDALEGKLEVVDEPDPPERIVEPEAKAE